MWLFTLSWPSEFISVCSISVLSTNAPFSCSVHSWSWILHLFSLFLPAGWLLLILLHPQVYYNFSLYFRMYKMQFYNFRMPNLFFLQNSSEIPHFPCLVCSFHLSPLQFWSPGWNSPLLIVLSHPMCRCLSFSPEAAVQSELWPFPQWFRSSWWEWECCIPGRGRSSGVTVSSPRAVVGIFLK